MSTPEQPMDATQVPPGQPTGPDPLQQPDDLSETLVPPNKLDDYDPEKLLDAINVCAQKAMASNVSQEASDFGSAALHFAQAAVILDPQRLAGGDTPAARSAAAPTPNANPPSGIS